MMDSRKTCRAGVQAPAPVHVQTPMTTVMGMGIAIDREARVFCMSLV